MSVSNETNKVRATANGVQTAFTFSFKIFVKGDLKVYTIVRSTGVATLMTVDTDYTVTINTVTEGGTVTFLVAPASTKDVLIKRVLAYTQPTVIPTESNFPEKSVENELDRGRMLEIQLKEEVTRSLKLSETLDDSGISTTLPTPSAGKSLKWNSTATGLENSTSDPDTVAAAAATSASAAATSATAAAASAAAAAASAAAAATAKTAAELAETNAETAEANAETAQAAAEAAKTAAETAETNAETAETNAETAETNAETAATAAAASATAAAGSATTASTQATNAATSATNAATSATNAANSATAAATAKTAAELAETNAETAEANAETAETNAAASAAAAAASAAAAAAILDFDATPNSDHSATGPHTNDLNAGESVTVMDLVYLKSDGEWWKTDADAASTAGGFLAIALETKTDGQAMDVALPGTFVRDDTWNWTVGATLYVSTTAGAITETQPSGTDDVIRVIGFAVTADVIYFNPSPDYITHT